MISKKLMKLNPDYLNILQSIGEIAQDRGLRAFIVGGIVRDLLLNIKNFDLDIAVEGDAVCIATIFAERFQGEVTVYKKFKTATVLLLNKQRVDFSTTRRELYKNPGALPEILSGDIYIDLSRRDISINAIAILINPNGFGMVYDEFCGCLDLQKKIIRVLHAKTFQDDPTRLFRVARYAGRLGFKIERWTSMIIKAAVENDFLKTISKQRVLNELYRVFEEQNSKIILQDLRRRNILHLIDPERNANFRTVSFVHREIKKEYNFFSMKLAGKLMLLGYFEGIKKANVEHALPLTNEIKKALLGVDQMHIIIAKLNILNKPSAVYSYLIKFPELLVYYMIVRTQKYEIKNKIKDFLKNRMEKTFITGDDLKRMGVVDGKHISSIKQSVLMAKIDKIIKTKKDELKFVEKFISR